MSKQISVSEVPNQLVEKYDLHTRLPEAKLDHDRTLIQRQIEATDKQIDELVYEGTG